MLERVYPPNDDTMKSLISQVLPIMNNVRVVTEKSHEDTIDVNSFTTRAVYFQEFHTFTNNDCIKVLDLFNEDSYNIKSITMRNGDGQSITITEHFDRVEMWGFLIFPFDLTPFRGQRLPQHMEMRFSYK